MSQDAKLDIVRLRFKCPEKSPEGFIDLNSCDALCDNKTVKECRRREIMSHANKFLVLGG